MPSRVGKWIERPSRRSGARIAACIVACQIWVVPAAAQRAATIDDLRWISGSWALTAGDRTTEEHWTAAASNSILAVGRTVQAGRVVFFEYLRIEARADGIVYIAQPLGHPPTEFRLASWDGRTVIFENLGHDFPKRISYTREGEDAITARVDGGAGVEKGAEVFRYRSLQKK